MARLNILNDRVQQLIDERLVPLLLVSGTVAGVAKLLNDALRNAGVNGTLHPNRLHALLSGDATRSLNEATIELTEQAAVLLLTADPAVIASASIAFENLRREAARLHLFSDASTDNVAQRLGIPVALAAKLSQDGTQSDSGKDVEKAEDVHRRSSAPPDWSYQDTAVARCLEAFGRRPSGRIGLILPTGAGKTRTALRIVLSLLGRCADSHAPAYWVTHRRNLKEQALRELQKLVATHSENPSAETLLELASRIKFVMVGELSVMLKADAIKPALIVIDEAHHAAAPSYQSVIENPWGAPVLLLTATPNRSDRLPIGIDEIAFTITYRELAERRAILTPSFLDFPVDDFDWSPDAIADLADYVIDHASCEFTKTLVLAPRVDRVEEFYSALVDRLPNDHVLGAEDIGFIHGSGNSMRLGNEDFLALFSAKPRAILVSAQILLEGFDDPSINAVVLTYPSTSVIRLMQAAGRCVRYAPEKLAAYVVQARNNRIAYHFDQRWLYQEIDDFLRPHLCDVDYGSISERSQQAAELLRKHRISDVVAQRILTRLEALLPGETCRLFLYGLPYFDGVENFDNAAHWGAILETSENSLTLRRIFNGFCALGADLSDPSYYLLRDGTPLGLAKDLSAGSKWLEMVGLLTASYFAKREVYGPTPIDTGGGRPYRPHGATTWLKYITFNFHPAVPSALARFLNDCHNAIQIQTEYLENPTKHAVAAKVPLPMGGAEAYLFGLTAYGELGEAIAQLRSKLAQAEPENQFAILAGFIAGAPYRGLPNRLLSRLEFLLHPQDLVARTLPLGDQSNIEIAKESTDV